MKYTIKEVASRFGDNNDWISVVFEEEPAEQIYINIGEDVRVEPGMTINGVLKTTKKGTRKLVKNSNKVDSRSKQIIAQSQIANAIPMVADHTDKKQVKDLAAMYIEVVLELIDEVKWDG